MEIRIKNACCWCLDWKPQETTSVAYEADQSSTCPKQTLSSHFTHHTLSTPFTPTLTIFPGSWLTNCCFRLGFIVLALKGEGKKHLKKPSQDTHDPMQYSKAGPWLTVSTLFPLVPQSTNLSAVNNLSIHSLTFPSFQSTWTTSKKRGKKKLKCPGHKPSIAQRNSLFKSKTQISELFSMPKRLHRKQCSQWMVDRKKDKSSPWHKEALCREKTLSKGTTRGDTHAHNDPHAMLIHILKLYTKNFTETWCVHSVTQNVQYWIICFII